ncbi:MAG TPA: PEP-CTERM sorting domain-containing protein [Burkholderiales bacterium]|nr:PEP-CTERM sorting domain-containing protein [Burkholderiales bacterium]
MSKKTRRASSTAVLSTLSLLVGASAQAGHFPAGNDPGGNGTVPGFTGQYILTIDDGCFSSPGLKYVEPNSSCNAASVYSGTVNLFGLTGPPTGPALDSFSLVNDSFGNDYWQISEVFVNDDLTLGGVLTADMGSYTTTGFYNDLTFWLSLSFEGDPVSQAFLSTDDFETEDGTSPPGRLIFGPECSDLNNCTVSIPEPGSLGLLFAALGGGWLARRRVRKSAEV